jgi:hypothetical protein
MRFSEGTAASGTQYSSDPWHLVDRHLHENLAAAELTLTDNLLDELGAIGEEDLQRGR